jgi:mono/diheme cytochrome c family protein
MLALLIQVVPYGRNHANPPVVAEPAWDSPQTRALADRACFDCHSNQTRWPWYANVAPASWLVQRDVDEGRRRLNFSEWNRSQQAAGAAPFVVESGEMPPPQYLPLHPEAQLSAAERQALAQGLKATIGKGQ